MIYQMIYTSLPHCLKPGSSGLGVVACTRGMPPDVIRTLSMFSGYSLVFPAHDEQAELNPKSFIHYLYNYAGNQYDVISQVKFAGFDYSGRSNVLAHHLMSEVNSRPQYGLAALIKGCCANNLLLERWEGEPYIIEKSAVWPAVESTITTADYWSETTGDAGWAGVVAAQAVLNPDKPLYVVFTPGVDSFRLLSEALNLLPPDLQWKVTFNTYFTRLHGQFGCAWRFCLRDCPALIQAQRSNDVLILDLAALKHDPLLVFPEAKNFIEGARNGSVVVIEQPVAEITTEREKGSEFNGDNLLAASEISSAPETPRSVFTTQKMAAAVPVSWDDDFLTAEEEKNHVSHRGIFLLLILVGLGVLLGAYGWYSKRVAQPVDDGNPAVIANSATNNRDGVQPNLTALSLPDNGTPDAGGVKAAVPANFSTLSTASQNSSPVEAVPAATESVNLVPGAVGVDIEVAKTKFTTDELFQYRMSLLNFFLKRDVSKVRIKLPGGAEYKINDLQLELSSTAANGVSYELEREGGKVFVSRKRHNTKLQTLLSFELLPGGLTVKRLQLEEPNENLAAIVKALKFGDFKYAVREAIYPAVLNGEIMRESEWILIPVPQNLKKQLELLPNQGNLYLSTGRPHAVNITPLLWSNNVFKVNYPGAWEDMENSSERLDNELKILREKSGSLKKVLKDQEKLIDFEKKSREEELETNENEIMLKKQQFDKINRQKNVWFSENSFSRLYLMYGDNILAEILLKNSETLNQN